MSEDVLTYEELMRRKASAGPAVVYPTKEAAEKAAEERAAAIVEPKKAKK